MRIPILLMSSPERKFWLTDEPLEGPRGHVVLIDAGGHVYCPVDVPGVIVLKAGTCSRAFYDAAQASGYQVVWID
jgi:hypothetical protein